DNPNPTTAGVFSATGQNAAGPTTHTTDASGQAQFCYTGTNVGGDTISAFADLNQNAAQDSGEPADQASVTYTPATPSSLTLAPQSATKTAGTQDCVSATLTDAYNNPNPNVAVVFAATGQHSAGPTSQTTDHSGQASF